MVIKIISKLNIDDILKIRRPIKAFLFDLDGTLIDSREVVIKTISSVLKDNGYYIIQKKIIKLFGIPIEEVFHLLLPELSANEIKEYSNQFREQYSKIHLKYIKLFPGVTTILKEIKEKGYKIGLATTKLRPFAIEILNHFKINNYFDGIISGYEVKNHKPAPDILIRLAEMLTIKISECVYIGDHLIDIEAGRNASMLTIAVLTNPINKKEIMKANPNFVIKSMKAFKFLKK